MVRWTDEHDVVIPTGQERAEQERQRAEQAQQQVALVEELLAQEKTRAERLTHLLRQAGGDPEQV